MATGKPDAWPFPAGPVTDCVPQLPKAGSSPGRGGLARGPATPHLRAQPPAWPRRRSDAKSGFDAPGTPDSGRPSAVGVASFSSPAGECCQRTALGKPVFYAGFEKKRKHKNRKRIRSKREDAHAADWGGGAHPDCAGGGQSSPPARGLSVTFSTKPRRSQRTSSHRFV